MAVTSSGPPTTTRPTHTIPRPSMCCIPPTANSWAREWSRSIHWRAVHTLSTTARLSSDKPEPPDRTEPDIKAADPHGRICSNLAQERLSIHGQSLLSLKYSTKRCKFFRFNLYICHVISDFCLFDFATLRQVKILTWQNPGPLGSAACQSKSFCCSGT